MPSARYGNVSLTDWGSKWIRGGHTLATVSRPSCLLRGLPCLLGHLRCLRRRVRLPAMGYLAFSTPMPAMALAGLAGCMAPRIRREHERVLAAAGALAMLAYLSGCWWGAVGFSWESVNSTPCVSSALALFCVGCLCAALASFACGYMVSGDGTDFPAGEDGERVWTVGCALFAAALLGLSARLMPNWTLFRVSATAAGPDDELLLGRSCWAGWAICLGCGR